MLIKSHLIVDFHALEVVCRYVSFLEHYCYSHQFIILVHQHGQHDNHHSEKSPYYRDSLHGRKKRLVHVFSIQSYMWHDGPMIPSTSLSSKKNCREIIALKQWHPVQSYKRTLPYSHPVWSKIRIALGDCIELTVSMVSILFTIIMHAQDHNWRSLEHTTLESISGHRKYRKGFLKV